MTRRTAVLYLTLTLALVVSACDGGLDVGNGDDDVLGLGDRGLDRCSLISETEAEEWLGGPVEVAPSEGFDGEPDPVTCFYDSVDSNASILIQVYDGEVFFAEVGSAARVGETIEGLGEDAFKGQGSVNFLQNDWSASVSLISGLIPDEDILEMAELVSSRLP